MKISREEIREYKLKIVIDTRNIEDNHRIRLVLPELFKAMKVKVKLVFLKN